MWQPKQRNTSDNLGQREVVMTIWCDKYIKKRCCVCRVRRKTGWPRFARHLGIRDVEILQVSNLYGGNRPTFSSLSSTIHIKLKLIEQASVVWQQACPSLFAIIQSTILRKSNSCKKVGAGWQFPLNKHSPAYFDPICVWGYEI